MTHKKKETLCCILQVSRVVEDAVELGCNGEDHVSIDGLAPFEVDWSH